MGVMEGNESAFKIVEDNDYLGTSFYKEVLRSIFKDYNDFKRNYNESIN
mgnify:CR=1 FL=1